MKEYNQIVFKDDEIYIKELGLANYWHFATFSSVKQLMKFQKRLGIKLEIDFLNGGTLDDLKRGILIGKIKNFIFKDKEYFWRLSDLPKGVKKIKLLSNGSIVDGYFKKYKNKILFYRPNPNAKAIYKPLTISKHIEFQKENGIY